MRIVKCRPLQAAQFRQIPDFVYCGRAVWGFPKSPLANPYKVPQDGTLPEVLVKYRQHLYGLLTADPAGPQAWAVQDALRQLHADSVLGCWCCDKLVAGKGEDACHCDVIARAWVWWRSRCPLASPPG